MMMKRVNKITGVDKKMKKGLEQWVNIAASQLEGMVEAKNQSGAEYHAGVYLRIAKHLRSSNDYFKQVLGEELVSGYDIACKNYLNTKEML